jgi:RNA polymerase sigma-B factor
VVAGPFLIEGVEWRALVRAYQEDGDLQARERLIVGYLPLVRRLARRYAGRGEPFEDLVQVGSIGLIKAIERFDLSRGAALAAYAMPTIEGEIKQHFRDRLWALTVPRGLKELFLPLSRLLDQLTGDLGRSPTIAEIASAARLSEEEVIEALEAGRAYQLHPPSGSPDQDGNEFGSIDTIPAPGSPYAASEDRAMLAAGFEHLDTRQRQILHLRFFHGMTQTQIAAQLGLSQMHVSRLIRHALKTLHNELQEPSTDEPATPAVVKGTRITPNRPGRSAVVPARET